jgi:hypothetical protein
MDNDKAERPYYVHLGQTMMRLWTKGEAMTEPHVHERGESSTKYGEPFSVCACGLKESADWWDGWEARGVADARRSV